MYANWLLRANDAMCIMSSLTILQAGYNIYSTTTRYVNQITELKVSWRYLVCCRGGRWGGRVRKWRGEMKGGEGGEGEVTGWRVRQGVEGEAGGGGGTYLLIQPGHQQHSPTHGLLPPEAESRRPHRRGHPRQAERHACQQHSDDVRACAVVDLKAPRTLNPLGFQTVIIIPSSSVIKNSVYFKKTRRTPNDLAWWPTKRLVLGMGHR